jgi:hypothetical protein
VLSLPVSLKCFQPRAGQEGQVLEVLRFIKHREFAPGCAFDGSVLLRELIMEKFRRFGISKRADPILSL